MAEILSLMLSLIDFFKDFFQNLYQKIKGNKKKATYFVIEHADEKSYLPFCIFANKYAKKEPHKRKIYKDFCLLDNNLQTLVLREQKIPEKINLYSCWIENCFQKLQEDIQKFHLGYNLKTEPWGDIYLNGFPFFQKALTTYKDYKWHYSNDTEKVCYKINQIIDETKPPIRCSFREYVSDFLEMISNQNNYSSINQLTFKSPLKEIEYSDIENAPEEYIVSWTLTIIEAIVLELSRRGLICQTSNVIPFENVSIDTFEDKYYQVLLILYNTYYIDPKITKIN